MKGIALVLDDSLFKNILNNPYDIVHPNTLILDNEDNFFLVKEMNTLLYKSWQVMDYMFNNIVRWEMILKSYDVAKASLNIIGSFNQIIFPTQDWLRVCRWFNHQY